MPEQDARAPQKEVPDRNAKLGVDPSGSKRAGLWSKGWVRATAALIVVAAVALLGGLLVVLLSDSDDDASGTNFTGDVRILTPRDGEVVTGPVALTVESPTWRIADPAVGIAGAAHFHAFVDIRPFTASGEVSPEKAGIYHFHSESLSLDLPPGEHRIIVALGDNEDVRIPGATVSGVTVTVE